MFYVRFGINSCVIFLKEQRLSLKDEFSYLDDTVIYHPPSGLCPICTQTAVDKLSPITSSSPYFFSSSENVFSKYVYWLRSCSHSILWGLFCRHPVRISAKSKSLSMFLNICHASTYKNHLEILNKTLFRKLLQSPLRPIYSLTESGGLVIFRLWLRGLIIVCVNVTVLKYNVINWLKLLSATPSKFVFH